MATLSKTTVDENSRMLGGLQKAKTLLPDVLQNKPRKALGNITNTTKTGDVLNKKSLGQLLGLKPKGSTSNVLSGAQRVPTGGALPGPVKNSTAVPPVSTTIASLVPRFSIAKSAAPQTQLSAPAAASSALPAKDAFATASSLGAGIGLPRQPPKPFGVLEGSHSDVQSSSVILLDTNMEIDDAHVQEMDMDIEVSSEQKDRAAKSSEVVMDSPASVKAGPCAIVMPPRNYARAEDEYEPEIMQHLRATEVAMHPSSTYMTKQLDINPKMREVLVDWLVEVHQSFKLHQETLFLAINLLDRFLDKRSVQRTKLQLVGCTALLIASKYEEMRVPEVKDFAYMTDNAYTSDQILFMEGAILSALEFHITAPSSVRFAQRFLTAVNNNSQLTMLTNYMMELTLPYYHMLKYKPSVVCAGSLLLAIKFTSNPWNASLEAITEYKEVEIVSCARDILRIFKNLPNSKAQAVRKKYSLVQFGGVSKLKLPNLEL